MTNNKNKISKDTSDVETRFTELEKNTKAFLIKTQELMRKLMDDDKLDPNNRLDAGYKFAEVSMMLFKLQHESQNWLQLSSKT